VGIRLAYVDDLDLWLESGWMGRWSRRGLGLFLVAASASACAKKTAHLPADAGLPADDAAVHDAEPTCPTFMDASTPDARAGVGADATAGAPDSGLSDGGPFDPGCSACRLDGQGCMFSINCQPGSICNDPTEDLYDPSMALDVCIKVVCASDADCPPGKTCGLNRLCNVPVCQIDSECAPLSCIGGVCRMPPPPTDVVDCTIIAQHLFLRPGNFEKLTAIARSANGAVLPAQHFDWTSSNPRYVMICDEIAVSASDLGTTELTAVVRGNPSVVCNGSIEATNLGP
jgi:hypothetical protein